MVRLVKVAGLSIGGDELVLIAGNDVIENEEITISTAEAIKKICERLGIGFIYKSSYRKDNRTSINAYTGPGLKKGLEILTKVKKNVGVPITSDIHGIQDVEMANGVLDMIQIPAFLCKQTSLLIEAGKSMKPINVKKGQFIDPFGMKYIAEKIESTGNNQVIFTERGSCFGYNMLVNDFRSLPIMRSIGYPVIFDVGHSIRMIGVPSGEKAGGAPEFIPSLTRAAFACGCDGLFLEVHPDPGIALCDSCSQYPISQVEDLLLQAKKINALAKPLVEAENINYLSMYEGKYYSETE